MFYRQDRNSLLLQFLLLFVVVSAPSCARANEAKANPAADNYRLAADYSKSLRGLSLLVVKDGKTVFEEYHNGHSATAKHMLASGTKSFSGVMCAAAIEDGLIRNFDEKVSDTIVEWRSDARRSRITIRPAVNCGSSSWNS